MNYTDKELESLLAAWDKITSVRSEDRKATHLTPNDPATIARLASELIKARERLDYLEHQFEMSRNDTPFGGDDD